MSAPVTDAQRWCLVELNETEPNHRLSRQATGTAATTGPGPGRLLSIQGRPSSGVRRLSKRWPAARENSVPSCDVTAPRRPIIARQTERWFDFGHIDRLADARRRLLRPRFFNALTVNPVLNTIAKVSEHT